VALIAKSAEDLRRIQERTGLSKTDVVNRAVTLYEFIDGRLAEAVSCSSATRRPERQRSSDFSDAADQELSQRSQHAPGRGPDTEARRPAVIRWLVQPGALGSGWVTSGLLFPHRCGHIQVVPVRGIAVVRPFLYLLRGDSLRQEPAREPVHVCGRRRVLRAVLGSGNHVHLDFRCSGVSRFTAGEGCIDDARCSVGGYPCNRG
jgi:hypothetical protein